MLSTFALISLIWKGLYFHEIGVKHMHNNSKTAVHFKGFHQLLNLQDYLHYNWVDFAIFKFFLNFENIITLQEEHLFGKLQGQKILLLGQTELPHSYHELPASKQTVKILEKVDFPRILIFQKILRSVIVKTGLLITHGNLI